MTVSIGRRELLAALGAAAAWPLAARARSSRCVSSDCSRRNHCHLSRLFANCESMAKLQHTPHGAFATQNFEIKNKSPQLISGRDILSR